MQASVYEPLFGGVNIAIDINKTLRYHIAALGKQKFEKRTGLVYKTITETCATRIRSSRIDDGYEIFEDRRVLTILWEPSY